MSPFKCIGLVALAYAIFEIDKQNSEWSGYPELRHVEGDYILYKRSPFPFCSSLTTGCVKARWRPLTQDWIVEDKIVMCCHPDYVKRYYILTSIIDSHEKKSHLKWAFKTV